MGRLPINERYGFPNFCQFAPNLSPHRLVFPDREGDLSVLISLRVSWWKWLLFSLFSGLLISVLILGAWVLLWLYWSVDLLDFIQLSRPPKLTDGSVAFLLLFAILGTTLVPFGLLTAFPAIRDRLFARFTWPRRGALLRLVLGAGLFICLQMLWERWGPQIPEELRVVDHLIWSVRAGGHLWPTFWLLLFVGCVGPFVEEVLFRGLFFGALRERYPFWRAALSVALLFGLGHGLVNGLPTGLMGLYFCYQVERDDSLVGAFLLHSANNLAAVLMGLLALS
jgi:membrane protease YdiL (CAAX protease family)